MKRWSLLISTMVLCTGLAACGDGNDEAVPATETDGVNEEENLEVDETDIAETSNVGGMKDFLFVTVELEGWQWKFGRHSGVK